MIETGEILQTMRMIQEENFDIRTITLGINLLDCSDLNPEECGRKAYDKICRVAEKLVMTGEEIETEFGIPIVNKRISVTPVSMICQADPLPVALALDRAAKTTGVNFLGGYSAMAQKGMTLADERLISSIPEALSQTSLLCASVNVASTRAGINMNAVRRMGEIIRQTAHLTADSDGLGCAKLVVFANAVEDNPFMAGAFCGPGEPECAINVGVSGPGVVKVALEQVRGEPFDVVAETVKRTAFKITRVGQLVAREASRRMQIPFMAGAFCGPGEPECAINVGVSGPGVVKVALEQVRGEPFDVVAETVKRTAFKITRVGQLVAREASRRMQIPFGIVDLSLAPTPARGDSVAHILTEMGLEMAGAPGTTAALALLNDAVKKGGVMASNHVGGLSGAFIPVSEDIGMIEAVSAGALTLEKLEAMTCVCSVGLDMIAIPGDTSADTVSGIIADEMAIGVVNQKTTAVRVIPVPGKKAGDEVEFGGLLGHAPVMPVSAFGNHDFIARGGRIPAPLHSLRN